MNIVQLEPNRLSQAKAAYTTRHVDLESISTLLTGDLIPEPGDLVLARIVKIGQHPRIELANGRRANLFLEDEVVVCYGNRYAPDQFEAQIPSDLSLCDLVAAGGLAAQAVCQHQKMSTPTALMPVGLLGYEDGRRVNLRDWALQPTSYIGQRPFTLAVVGTSMNAGKTTTAANVIKGLVNAGLKVGAAKVTGTGAGGDIWLMGDAGASLVLDFTAAGYPSTYQVGPKQVQQILATLTSHLAAEGVEAIVLEVADGLYQEETSALVTSLTFRRAIDGVLFAAGSALGAAAGVEWLRKVEVPVLAVSGVVAASPLAMREAEQATGLPVLDLENLRNPDIVTSLGVQTKVALLV